MMHTSDEADALFDKAAAAVVELGNRIMEDNNEADPWDVASGILAGAVQFWLYSRQPCGDPYCESCGEVATAEQRMRELLKEIRQFAEESDYYHSPHDTNVGRA